MARQSKSSTQTNSNDPQALQTVRIPLFGNVSFRNSSIGIDQEFINCLVEIDEDKNTGQKRYYVIQRPGMSNNTQPAGTSGVGRGIYSWRGDLYTVIGSSIYKNTTLLYNSMTTSTGRVGITQTHPSAATQYLAINDGVKLFVISTGGVVTAITVNFPTPNTTDLIAHDGYFFTLKTDGTLWNCSFNDPTSWSLTSYVTAQMEPDGGVALAHQNNYVVVLKESSFQFYYDAANSPGSPMSNVEQAMQQVGAVSQGSVCHNENTVFFVGNGGTGGFVVYKLDGTTNLQQISNESLNRILTAEGSNLSSCYANLMRVSGHYIYVLNLTGINRSFVWDETSQEWTEWTDFVGTAYFPIVMCTQHNNQLVGLHTTDGYTKIINATTYQDYTNNFTVSLTTNPVTFDTMKRKFWERIELVGDIQTVSCPVILYYTDNDYQSFSSGFSFDMSSPRSWKRGWGSSRRRAFKLTKTANSPLRLFAIEADIRLGEY